MNLACKMDRTGPISKTKALRGGRGERRKGLLLQFLSPIQDTTEDRSEGCPKTDA
jgi:hypothetical protein